MSDGARTFSESWYRIAQQQLCLRPHVKVRRQYFRGEKWFVLHDPFNNQFFRLRPASYDFVARLRLDRTVEDVWRESISQNPDDAPGQEDSIQLLAQLHHANLLQYRMSGDTGKLFERFKKRRQKEIQSRFLNIMFARFPLLDPDDFLKRALPVVGWLFGAVGALLWLTVVAFAVKLAVENGSALWAQTEGILAPGNLALLYVAFALIKGFHEFGHAFVCRRYGGEVHVMGIMLLIFTPIPYMDATASWAFRSRWKRMYVASAGILTEVFVAAAAAIVWAHTGQGMVHSLAYNMMFVASVSTVLFNGNPLLRFDGYYILSDLLDIPNLHPRASQQLIYWAERYAFGFKKSRNPAQNWKESFWLTLFGICSHIYRIFVFGGIILFVTKRFLLLGVVMAVICVISWVLYPIGKFLYYLVTSPKLERTRVRAVTVSACVGLTLLIAVGIAPFPSTFRSPGIIKARRYALVANQESGTVAAILTPTGRQVTVGQPLLRLENRELGLEAELVHAQHRHAKVLHRQALQGNIGDLKPIKSHLQTIEKRLRHLEERRNALVLCAEMAGTWVAPQLDDMVGVWVERGQPVGQILGPGGFEFTATVAQEKASRLFETETGGAEVRLHGQAHTALVTRDVRVIPADRQTLPSPALGYRGGGEVAVDLTDPQGMRAAEPFFEVRAPVVDSEDVTLVHGRSGRIRFELRPEPLFQQCVRKIRQLLQKRSRV